MSFLEQGAVDRILEPRFNVMRHDRAVSGCAINVVRDRLIGLCLQAASNAWDLVEAFGQRSLEPIPHLVKHRAHRVEEPVVAWPQTHVRCPGLLNEFQSSDDCFLSAVSLLFVRITECAEFAVLAPETVRTDSHYLYASFLYRWRFSSFTSDG